MASVDFEQSPEVKNIAIQIIDKHHEHLQDAKDLIGFYFRYGNSDWAGKAKKCTAFERHVTGKMMFVFINHDAWQPLHHEQRLALVDHELCHFARSKTQEFDNDLGRWKDVWCAADDPESWGIRDHDVEEFSDVIRRHGLWEKGIEAFAQAVRSAGYQMTFDDVMNQPEESGPIPLERGQAV